MNAPRATTVVDTAADNESSDKGPTIAPAGYQLADAPGPLRPDELRLLDAWWRAANYLSVGQIYLMDNPLLRRPLAAEDVKPRLLGHWGTTPGLNFVYVHANRAIRQRELNACYVMGPGHGGPGPNACAWLEGTYTERYPSIRQDEVGMQRLFHQFSFPGGVPSHVAPNTPGSFHEGGELGYSLLHAYGAALDHPGLTVFCVIGDGEAETGALATSWHANKFLNPRSDGTVLPILHLNGYKIANPTVLARIPEEDLSELLRGYGYDPRTVCVDIDENPAEAHQSYAGVLDGCLDAIDEIRTAARRGEPHRMARWPMIVLRSPKGWTGPRIVDGQQVEGTFRAHQVPIPAARTDDAHRAALEGWMRSYRPEELFTDRGSPVDELLKLPPKGTGRMSDNPVADGGRLVVDLELPDFRGYGVPVEQPGRTQHEATRVLGGWVRDAIAANPDNFLLFGPDEVVSNRLSEVFDVTDRKWLAQTEAIDDHLSPDGRVIEVLSEQVCQGLLEGYLLTGRHGLFTCYEAFIHIIDSMFNQHAKWLEAASRIPWRRPVASLNYLLTSHVWRQDHNGSTHQDPGFLTVVMNKKASVARVYLPPDTNCLLSVADHCLRSRQYVNVIVAGKQPALDYLDMDQAVAHCTRGIGVWDWASTESDEDEPDVVLACAGDVPTLESLAAADLIRQHLPEVKVRFVNIVDIMRLLPDSTHPHGLPDAEFDALFTVDRPVIFAWHGYPATIHRLTYRRVNHDNFHVRGFIEEGTTTTPFDMVMMNNLDRYHLVTDVIDRVPGLAARAASTRQAMVDARRRAREWTRTHGDDHPEVADWVWPYGAVGEPSTP
jgi:xylulose-5-phosphate/fructose-6-phosphate phosphoketolase